MTASGRPSWGEGVRTLRGIKDLSQVELAARARVGQATISRIENGSHRVSDAARVRIARALDVQPYELFPYIEDDEQVSA